MRRPQFLLIVVGLVAMSVVGCASDDSSDSATSTTFLTTSTVEATTTAEATTATTEAPTTASSSTSVAEPSSGLDEVIFDGVGCIVTSPPSVPTGARLFVLTNNSDLDTTDLRLYVSSLLDGHEFQDLLDLQAEVGGSPNYYPKPDWVEYEITRFDLEGDPDVEVANNQILIARTLTEGEDAIYIYVRGKDDASQIWFCAPLKVSGE